MPNKGFLFKVLKYLLYCVKIIKINSISKLNEELGENPSTFFTLLLSVSFMLK